MFSAEVLVKEVEELRRELIEIKMEERINQGKLETTMASVKGLTLKRISEMTAMMAQKDRQANERLKLMSETMHRREMNIDKRMADPMPKVVVATVPSRHSLVPVAQNAANEPSTRAFPAQQPTNREVVQRQSGTKTHQIKQPNLQLPATYKRVPVKARTTTGNRTEFKRCEVFGPPSFDSNARGASTTGYYYSAASGQMTSDVMTATGDTEYQTAVSLNTGTEHPALYSSNDQLRLLASSTQRKTTSKRSLNRGTVGGAAKDKTPNAMHSQTLAEAITTALSKCLEQLLAAKETKNKPTKNCGLCDGIVNGWLMLMKRYLEKAHAKGTALHRAWTIIEFLETEHDTILQTSQRLNATRMKKSSRYWRVDFERDANTTAGPHAQSDKRRILHANILTYWMVCPVRVFLTRSYRDSSKGYAALSGSEISHSCTHMNSTWIHLQLWKHYGPRYNSTCACAALRAPRIIQHPSSSSSSSNSLYLQTNKTHTGSSSPSV